MPSSNSNRTRIIIGADPSYLRFGLCFLTLDRDGLREIRLCSFSQELPEGFRFVDMILSTKLLVDKIKSCIKETLSEDNLKYENLYVPILSMEVPPPTREFSAGLYMLDTVVYLNLSEFSELTFVSYPNKIGSLLGPNYKKGVSVSFLRDFTELNGIKITHGETVNKRKTHINHDEAESAVLAIFAGHVYGESFKFPEYVNLTKWR